VPNLSKAQTEVLQQRRVASVATIGSNGVPHLTAVWFFYDGESFYLAIPSTSAKAKNLDANRQMALMIDVRESGKELGISVSGQATILEGETARAAVAQVHAKYLSERALADPEVGPTFAKFDDVAVQLKPDRWIFWDMAAVDQQAFGGKLRAYSYLKDIVP
jgi:nitroimidazol reductase NimA-like FMN-containing flavoprotein (pyridoxamine 5'-phosphate oxidase superfamily)